MLKLATIPVGKNHGLLELLRRNDLGLNQHLANLLPLQFGPRRAHLFPLQLQL